MKDKVIEIKENNFEILFERLKEAKMITEYQFEINISNYCEVEESLNVLAELNNSSVQESYSYYTRS